MAENKEEITERFAENLRRWRRARQLSQRALAEKAGVGEIMIFHYEAGQKTPRIDTLVALAEVLDVSVGELLGEDSFRFRRCVEIADKLGYEVSLDDDENEVFVERRRPKYSPKDTFLEKEDFMDKMDTLEKFALSLSRVRDYAGDILFHDEF